MTKKKPKPVGGILKRAALAHPEPVSVSTRTADDATVLRSELKKADEKIKRLQDFLRECLKTASFDSTKATELLE